jgi:transposase-like protein
MPSNIRRQHPASFKVQVVLELLKETKTVAQVCSQYSIHPTQAGHWKNQALAGLQSLFTNKPVTELARKNQLIDELYRQVGQLKVELDWLKKKMGISSD